MIYEINDAEAQEAVIYAEWYAELYNDEMLGELNFDEDFDCTYDVRDDRLY